MKFLRTATVLVLSVFVLTACDDDDTTTSVEVADLAGAWNTTQFEYTDNANPSFSIDVISTLNGSLTIDVNETGSFTGEVEIPNVTPGPLPIGGTFSISGDSLSVDFNAQTESYDLVDDFDAAFTLSGNVLTLTNNDVTYDFNDTLEAGSGLEVRGEVSATVDVVLQR